MPVQVPSPPPVHAEHVSETIAAAAASAGAADGFLPHGYCYLWNKPLLLTHVTSDVLIGVSYVVISLALVSLVHQARRDIPFSVLFVAFGLFIVACGLTHFMEIWTLWQPVYWLSGGVKAVTAVASVTTAAVMPMAVPRVLATVRDAGLAREREVAAARAAALEEQNELLQTQAVELEHQTESAQLLAEELEQANRDLVRALREAERAREEADEARRAAEAANRAKSEFLAVMSHELRTPLNAIGGYAELLELGVYGPVTEAQTGTLARIVGSQRHLLRLVNEVLNLARIEAGRVDYAREAVRVAEVVAAVAPMLEPQMAAAGLALRTVVPAELAACGDRDKVQQILINLLTNAVKFTPEGGAVTVSAERDAAGEQVLVRVADTGVGIPPEKWTTVFEPFVQVQASHAGRREGTGLGLSISRDLARGMGGDLLLRSAVGEGSTFTLVLPAD